MTEEELRAQQEAQQRAQQEFARQVYEQRMRASAEQAKVNQAAQMAQERQHLMDTEPRQRYVMIAAVDLNAGIGKGGKLPWHYKEDLQWFKKHTTDQICVMGKDTYLDINERLGERAKDSVLPDRKCFVVTSTLNQEDVKNATVIGSIYDVPMLLLQEDVDKTIFFIGGARIFQDCLSLVDEVLLTVINKSHDCDRFFPVDRLYKIFEVTSVQQASTTDELRFITYTRKR